MKQKKEMLYYRNRSIYLFWSICEPAVTNWHFSPWANMDLLRLVNDADFRSLTTILNCLQANHQVTFYIRWLAALSTVPFKSVDSLLNYLLMSPGSKNNVNKGSTSTPCRKNTQASNDTYHNTRNTMFFVA